MKCPRCESREVYKSASGNAKLIWPLPWFVVSVRCHDCSKRFFRRGVLLGGEKVPAKISRKGTVRVDDASAAKPNQKDRRKHANHGPG